MGLFASIALNPAVKCGQNADSGGVGDGGVSNMKAAGAVVSLRKRNVSRLGVKTVSRGGWVSSLITVA